jgi:hypothetical protein
MDFHKTSECQGGVMGSIPSQVKSKSERLYNWFLMTDWLEVE